MLNCKQGDLAVIVRSMAGNEGKIVQCPRLVFDPWHYFDGPRWLIACNRGTLNRGC